MNRLVVLFFVLCVPLLKGEEQEQNLPTRTRTPIYRGVEPLMTQLQAETRSSLGETSTIVDFEKWLESYPESMRPWKPEDLEGVKVFLPLGEGESIQDKIYQFTVAWNEETPQPLHIINDRSHWEFSEWEEQYSPLRRRAFRYRPIELAKDHVVRFKFEFRPVKFRPLDGAGAPDPADFRANTEFLRNQIAPKPEFLDPLVIQTAQLKTLVNGKNEGFTVHFSNDGEKWYSVNPRPGFRDELSMPRGLLPSETFYVRIATEEGEPIKSFSFDFEAILETHGFRGTGTTGFGETYGGDVCFPLAFYDGNDDLVLLIDNAGSEPHYTGLGHYNFSGSGYRYRTRNSSGFSGGGFMSSHRMSIGPTIPANGTGVYIQHTDKGIPGSHGYIFNGFNFRYQCKPDPMSPNPPKELIRTLAESRSKENQPKGDQPFVTFED